VLQEHLARGVVDLVVDQRTSSWREITRAAFSRARTSTATRSVPGRTEPPKRYGPEVPLPRTWRWASTWSVMLPKPRHVTAPVATRPVTPVSERPYVPSRGSPPKSPVSTSPIATQS
jgi:hypothetical protein